jgi:hypothetical protein
VMFSRIHPPLGLGASAAASPVVISHVRGVHRAQRYPSGIGNLRLLHPTFTQQQHLDSLPYLRIFLALKRSLQPPHLVRVAFDHLGPRSESDGLKRLTFRVPCGLPFRPRNKQLTIDSSRFGGGISSVNRRARALSCRSRQNSPTTFSRCATSRSTVL